MGATSQGKWWGEPEPVHNPITCPSCGRDKSHPYACCPNEKMRRSRERVARNKAKRQKQDVPKCPYCGQPKTWKICCDKARKIRDAENKAKQRARKRNLSLNKEIPEENRCPHCQGDKTLFRVCCPEERKRRYKKRRDLNKKYQTAKRGTETSKPQTEIYTAKEPHRCCDCGKITPDRRCEPCRKKWQQKHGVSTRHSIPSSEWAEW